MSTPRWEIRARMSLAAFALDVDVTSEARSLGVFGPSGAGKTSLVEALAPFGGVRIEDDLFVLDGAERMVVNATREFLPDAPLIVRD